MNPAKTDPTVLIVDDDEAMRYGLARELKKCGCIITEISSVEAAVEDLEINQYDIIFSDMRFPCGMDGEELLEVVVNKYPSTHVILVSCSMDGTRSALLTNKGASFCMQKPVFEQQCHKAINSLRSDSGLKAA